MPDMTNFRPPKDGVRAMPPGSLVGEGDGKTLFGRIAPFGQWAEIDSVREGHFLERVMPGSTTKTFAETTPKILFQHGKDPGLGNRLIAEPLEFGEDGTSPFYRAAILDGLDPLIVDGLRRGLYGSSQTFIVVRDEMAYPKAATPHNPNMLPERTIREMRVPELGPVTWPAYFGTATAARSLTDEFFVTELTTDLDRLADLVAYVQTNAPSADAGASPHLEPERRDLVPETTGNHTQLDSLRKDDPVTDSLTLHPVEQEARITELEGSLRALDIDIVGSPTIEQQTRWDADTDELNKLRAARTLRVQRAAFLGTLPEANRVDPYTPPTIIRTRGDDIYDMGQYGPGQVRSAEDQVQKLRDNAMRSLEASSFQHSTVIQDRAKDGVQAILDHEQDRHRSEIATRMLLSGSPKYRREFAESLVTMEATEYIKSANRAAALAVIGTTTTGGYMLPYTFDPTFIKTGAWTNINPYRQICRVIQITGSNRWEGVSVGAVPAIYETEALAATEAGPTFARPYRVAQRASSFVTVSYETLGDRPDIGQELADLIQEGKDTLEEGQFSIGVGSTVYPLGMFVKSTFTVKETITDNTFAVADLDATEAALPIRHRRDAVWMLARGVIRIIEGWETAYGKYFNSTLGYPAVGPINNNPGGNTGKNLLGYPVWETPSAPVTVTSDDTIVGILVSPKNYAILDRVGMNVRLIPDMFDATTGAPTGQSGFFALWRNSAWALNADAGRQININ